jgi:TolB-like protein
LVTGTVRKAGAALRITTELVEARTDAPIWSEKFSGTMDDVFGMQEEIWFS